MPRRRWMLGQLGIAMCAGFFSGCLFKDTGRSDGVAPQYSPPMDVDQSSPPPPSPPLAPPPKEAIELLPAPPGEAIQKIMAKEPAEGPPLAPPPPPPPDPPAIAALRAYLNPNPDPEAARKLAQLSEIDRKVLDFLLPIVERTFTNGLDHGQQDIDLVLQQLALFEETLRPRASLTLSKVSFTRAIYGFGDYMPLQTTPPESIPSFRAGKEDRPGERIKVYAEVRNAINRKAGGLFETVLASRVEIINSKGEVDFRMDRPACPDRSLSARQDYYLNIDFMVPPHMPPGVYKLKITVRDVADGTANARQAIHEFAFRVEPAP